MNQYIEINGISSLSFGLGLLNADLSLLPARRKERESLYGAIRALEGEDYLYSGGTLSVTLAARGTNKATVMAAFDNAAGWLSGGRFLRLWSRPDYFFEGSFEGSQALKMLAKGIGEMTFDFALNPGCAQRGVGLPLGWVPALNTPVPEQTNDTVCTVKKAFTAPGALPSAGDELNAVLPPALYLAITGTWKTLTIGGALTITEAFAASGTVYIDGDRQQVYRLVDGVRHNVKHNGDFPLLPNDGILPVGGTDMNITARMLVIERR